jgi:uncharacterized protein
VAEASKTFDEKQEKLKSIIRKLHEGSTVDEVRKDFERFIKNVSPEEIATVESSLIREGLPVEEVQRLCDVHARVFDAALKRYKNSKKLPGHPVYTYIEENRALSKLLKKIRQLVRQAEKKKGEIKSQLLAELGNLKLVEFHYARKENQLFPFLEKASFTGPSKVMWGKHNENREKLKAFEKAVTGDDWRNLKRIFTTLSQALSTMIFLEERILFPTSLRKLSDEQWIEIRQGEPEIGYAWIKPGNLWDASLARKKLARMKKTEGSTDMSPAVDEADIPKGVGIALDTGLLTREQINLMLKNLPIDVSFVDENDRVQYYSQNKERIFPRSPGVIGREVQNCHPPKSLAIVNKIIESFRKKEKSSAEFWINLSGKFIYIRYLPVYDDEGAYKGVLEVSQDVTAIRGLQGEKRLLDWE